MNNIGLVFSGGGVKGAYEIGVWKYLKEEGLDKKVSAISGTSVGALNAALFVGSDFKTANEIWSGLKQGDVTSIPSKKELLKKYVLWMSAQRIKKLIIPKPTYLRAIQMGIDISKTSVEFILYDLLCQLLYSDGIFSRKAISSIIEILNFTHIQKGEVPCYATCMRMIGYKIKRFELSKNNNEDIKKILLASSAIPVIFKGVRIKFFTYYDGGIPVIGDNTPIKPIYELNVENIIVVYLNQNHKTSKSKYPNSRVIDIIPSEDLGGLKAVVQVDSNKIQHMIDLGYKDAKKALSFMADD